MTTVAAGALGTLAGCDDGNGGGGGGGDAGPDAGADPFGATGSAEDIARVFPQGVCSGDPTHQSVILWTRAETSAPAAAVAWQLARDPDFLDLVAQGEVEAVAESDHTVRLKVTDLEPDTALYYRFRADGVVTEGARTRTAPAPDADAEPRFAFASCQDFNGRYYHAWRLVADQADALSFVVFLGDYIYETAADPRFQEEGGRRVTVPDGLELNEEGAQAARTLADYRSLYRQYRSDADLQRAHALLPFFTIWDDHEFADDAWQDHSTHFNGAMGDEQDTERRTAASRAWYEYQPVDLDRLDRPFPDDLSIYRAIRWGRHVELFLTDQRSYRDDHVIPEGPTNAEVGKTSTNSALGSRQFVFKPGFDPIEAAARPTMLGDVQRAWLVDGVRDSGATWKFWGSETMMAQFAIDLSDYEMVPESFRGLFYLTVDQWDGYRSERAEILEALSGVENLVVLTGDLHAWQAGHLRPDFDAPGDATAVEFVTAGVSSRSFQEIVRRVVDDDAVLSALGLGELVDQLDDIVAATNPHLAFTQNQGYGFATVDVGAEALEVVFHDIESEAVRDPDYAGGATPRRFRVARGSRTIEQV